MRIPREEAICAYMRACVRMHAVDARHVDGWTRDDLAAAFQTLAGPLVEFETWLERMGMERAPTEEELLAHNEAQAALSRLQELAGQPVRVATENTGGSADAKG